jgi:hypothetical protein
MSLSTKVEPIDRDVAVILREELSPAARSAVLAAFAKDARDDAKEQNRAVLGRVPPFKTFVDGSEGSAEDRVKPDGVIVYEFELLGDLFVWIGEQLHRYSPVLTGRYQRSHTLFADGAEVAIGDTVPPATEYVFMSTLPYARKIERGESSQAPSGVYELVTAQARARFGNIARIDFSYRTAIGSAIIGGRIGNRSDQRNPAIIVTVR